MLIPTIYYFGNYLSNFFNIPKERIKLASKDELFRILKTENLTIDFPSIAFFPTNIEFDDIVKAKYLGVKLSTSKGRSIGYKIIQVKLTFSIYLVSTNIEDYFNLTSKYFFLTLSEGFDVKIYDEEGGIDDYLKVPIVGIEPTGFVEGGKEGFDYDRGVYYVSQGSVTVRTFLFSDEVEIPVAKKINVRTMTFGGSELKHDVLQKFIFE